MRDLLFVLIFSPLVLLSLIRPWSGLLTFSWIAFLKPQSILMSLGTQVPFTLIIAITTTIGWALSKERKGFEIDLTAILFHGADWARHPLDSVFIDARSFGNCIP